MMKGTKIISLVGLSVLVVCLGCIAPGYSATGDVIDDFQYSFTACSGEGNRVWADVDSDGTYDTQVVFLTLTGIAYLQPEFNSGKWYFFSYQSNSPSSWCQAATEDRGRQVIHFVDILAPGFVWDNPSTWTYKSIPAVSIKAHHDDCVRPGATVTYYQSVQAYRQRQQNGPVQGTQSTVGDWEKFDFRDPAGIMELYITTDYCENNLDDLILGAEYRPGVVQLFDLSGSMSWSYQGQAGVQPEEQKLRFAKNAAEAFLDLLYDHYPDQVHLGLSAFPRHPWSLLRGCQGQVIKPVAKLDQAHYNEIKNSVIPGLQAEGNTPLLAGGDTARTMFTNETPRIMLLLSDGYHNCPSLVDVDDPEVLNLIQDINNQNIRVYTVGFAQPNDIEFPLLAALADQTGGFFLNVTGSLGFDPGTWHPATALASDYKTILVDGLGFQPISDPLGVVAAGQTAKHTVGISEFDRKLSVYLSWAKPEAKLLGLTIKTSDGQPLPAGTHPGIKVHQTPGYTIVTIGKPFLQQPGKIGPTAWSIDVDGKNLGKGQSEPYQLSVLGSSDLKMAVSFDQPSYATGDDLVLRVQLSQKGQLVTGLKNIGVQVTKPEDGIGNWFAAHSVTPAQLQNVSAKVGSERLSLAQRKARVLKEQLNTPFPGRTAPASLGLFDDGTHGDQEADDGIYTGRLTNLAKEGTYAFAIQASGTTPQGLPFTRQVQLQKYVNVKVTGTAIDAQITLTPFHVKDKKRYAVTVTPKDAMGNFLGPRHAGKIAVKLSQGDLAGKAMDNLDGSYTQWVDMPADADLKKVNLDIKVGKATLTRKMDEPYVTPTTAWLMILTVIIGALVFWFVVVKER
jgi:hypothetical protein